MTSFVFMRSNTPCSISWLVLDSERPPSTMKTLSSSFLQEVCKIRQGQFYYCILMMLQGTVLKALLRSKETTKKETKINALPMPISFKSLSFVHMLCTQYIKRIRTCSMCDVLLKRKLYFTESQTF